jgi:hypothetical protein
MIEGARLILLTIGNRTKQLGSMEGELTKERVFQAEEGEFLSGRHGEGRIYKVLKERG